MPVKVSCPSGHKMRVPDKYIGKAIRCPKCQKAFRVRAAEAAVDTKRVPPARESAPASAARRNAGTKPAEGPASSAAESAAKPSPIAAKPPAPPTPAPQKSGSRTPPSAPPPAKAPPKPAARKAEKAVPPVAESSKKPVWKGNPPATPPAKTPPKPASEAASRPAKMPESAPPPPPRTQPLASRTESVEQESPATPPEPHTESDHHPVPKPNIKDWLKDNVLATDVAGYEHEPHRKWTVYYLAMAIAGLALFGMAPGILDVVDHFRSVDSVGIARWALLVIVIGFIQLAYVVYVIQLPDFSSVWVVTGFTLFLAGLYAMMLALTTLGGGGNQFIEALDLADLAANKKAGRWCFVMLCLSSLMAYFGGRVSVKWQRIFRQKAELAGDA